MAALNIIRMGHPTLRQIATAYGVTEIPTTHVQNFAKTLLTTLKKTTGMGISAPQVGVSRQLMIVQIPKNKARPDCDELPLSFCFNPVIEVAANSTTIQMWESCLSLPGIVAKVERYNDITVRYLDQAAKPRRFQCTGFIAGVIQHEADHLQGKLFIDRVKEYGALAFREEWNKYANNQGICLAGKLNVLE